MYFPDWYSEQRKSRRNVSENALFRRIMVYSEIIKVTDLNMTFSETSQLIFHCSEFSILFYLKLLPDPGLRFDKYNVFSLSRV